MSETNVFESNPYHDVSFEISSRSSKSNVKKYFFNIYSIQNCFSRSNPILLAIIPQKKIVDKFSSTLHTMKKANIHSTSYNATFEVEKQKSRILGVYRCKVEAPRGLLHFTMQKSRTKLLRNFTKQLLCVLMFVTNFETCTISWF